MQYNSLDTGLREGVTNSFICSTGHNQQTEHLDEEQLTDGHLCSSDVIYNVVYPSV